MVGTHLMCSLIYRKAIVEVGRVWGTGAPAGALERDCQLVGSHAGF